MVAALVARILEDPQLEEKQINLSWTTTVGEVHLHIHIPRLLVELFDTNTYCFGIGTFVALFMTI